MPLGSVKISFFYSNLNCGKQGVEINDTQSFFEIPDMAQESIICPTFLEIFLNDLFLFIIEAELANFTNKLCIFNKDFTKLKILRESDQDHHVNAIYVFYVTVTLI